LQQTVQKAFVLMIYNNIEIYNICTLGFGSLPHFITSCENS